MQPVSFRIFASALMVVILAAPAFAFDGTQVPSRNANIWDWRAHQPTENEVRQQEAKAGIAPSQTQNEAASATVDQLYQQLLGTRG